MALACAAGGDQVAQEFVVPKAVVSPGWNTLTLRPKYAVAPTPLAQGQSADPRLLAAGFTQLLIEPQPIEPQPIEPQPIEPKP